MSSGKEIVLGLDTSNSPLLAAVTDGRKTASCRRKGVKQEKLLFPALESALGKLGAELSDVKTVFVVRGPGRFTGIRISLTFASMLQMLNRARVRGATMFEVICKQASESKRFGVWKKQHPAGVLAVALHAFREEYFLQIFDEQNAAPAWLSREELQARLAAYKRPLFVAGSDKDGFPLDELLEGKYAQADDKDCSVRAATLLAMAQDARYDKDALEPLYLKPARFELVTPQ